MIRTLLQAKLHRVKLTQADLDYEGSCGIDEALLDAFFFNDTANTEIYNISNGARFSTYAIKAPRDSGKISLNGAAARLACLGDLLIICAYSGYTESELASYRPRVVLVDEHNRARR